MVRMLFSVFVLILSTVSALANPDLGQINKRAVDEHVLPRVEAFRAAASDLQSVAQESCDPASADLIRAFHNAVDDWTRMSHLRFGPTETDDRAFALAFWPDGRGKTPKALAQLLANGAPVAANPKAFRETSIAARGLYALEFMLYDETTRAIGTETVRCDLIQAITRDVAANAEGIAADWATYKDALLMPNAEGLYRTEAEATQELYKALSTGLQFTSQTRLARPLGTFERPRPRRAELRRSGRSLRQVQMSLEGTQELAAILAIEAPDISARLDSLYERTFAEIGQLDDPVFANVAEVQGRLRVEILQISIDEIRELVAGELGPALGVAAGFNALDGD